MISKQLSWGRSSVQYLFFSLILLFTPIFIQSMDNEIHLQNSWRDLLPSYFEYKTLMNEVREVVNEQISERPRLLTDEEKKTYRFHGTTWHQMMQAYEAAPWEVHHIVDHLNNPNFFGDADYRGAVFVGGPGGGKSVTAKAIAHVVNWYCKFIGSSVLEGIHRNETAKNLLTSLTAIANDRRRKTVVVLDEAEEFFEDFESDKFDTKATGTAFRLLFDQLAGNPNIFLICTMNRDTKIPQQIKNRFEPGRIIFNPIKDPIRKRTIFRNQLENTTMKLDAECNDGFLDQCVGLLKDVPLRSYQNVRIKVSQIIWHNNPTSRIILKQHLLDAVNSIMKSRKDSEIDRKEESSQEIQERHYQANLDLQKRHFAKQQLIQALAAASSDHYLRSFIDEVGRVTNINSEDRNCGHNLACSMLSDEEIKLYKEMVQRSQEKKKNK